MATRFLDIFGLEHYHNLTKPISRVFTISISSTSATISVNPADFGLESFDGWVIIGISRIVTQEYEPAEGEEGYSVTRENTFGTIRSSNLYPHASIIRSVVGTDELREDYIQLTDGIPEGATGPLTYQIRLTLIKAF